MDHTNLPARKWKSPDWAWVFSLPVYLVDIFIYSTLAVPYALF